MPGQTRLEPSYEQKAFPASERRNRITLVGSSDGRENSVTIHQDVDLYSAVLDGGASVSHTLKPGRYAWVQVTRGDVRLNGAELHAGDGAALSDESAIALEATSPTEALIFDLP
jgi:redox-sensitive bicupin YhaK (pirin superfamily)